jgi:hypothetical protein
MSEIRLKNEVSTITGSIPKSKLVLGKFTIFFDKKFNWFNRLMLRLVFGLNIENVKDSD